MSSQILISVVWCISLILENSPLTLAVFLPPCFLPLLLPFSYFSIGLWKSHLLLCIFPSLPLLLTLILVCLSVSLSEFPSRVVVQILLLIWQPLTCQSFCHIWVWFCWVRCLFENLFIFLICVSLFLWFKLIRLGETAETGRVFMAREEDASCMVGLGEVTESV